MPDYGIRGPDEGTGLLPWSWAEERLAGSHDYWLTSLWPDGRPHSMPVWGAWDGEALWFSSGRRSRKARNLAADPRCIVTTDDPKDPVVVEGRAELVVRPSRRSSASRRVMSAKYGNISADFLAAARADPRPADVGLRRSRTTTSRARRRVDVREPDCVWYDQ